MMRCMQSPEVDPAAAEDAATATHSTFAVSRWRGGELMLSPDEVAEEVPVALEYNGISHAVMLATPADLKDFALGFSLSEGIVARASDVYDIEVDTRAHGIAVQLEIASEAFMRLKDRRRTLAGRTGCGLCGTESLEQVMRAPAPVHSTASFHTDVIQAAFVQLQLRQALQRHTGATHAAAWLRADGHVSLVREDVGRHNALDKLAGALARSGEDIAGGAVLVTSRASYEMVLKTAAIGAGMLAAVSAPTALAVRLAEQSNVTLAGFVRAGAHVVYAHPQRLQHGLQHEASLA
ncbi:formate dehydrogenase formation protein [Cupriavidus taiwanensis]|uniref:Sulfur carrier protein FdhD n=1 Tax=Cupriavidus taiwanensis TaxID=164546 RepID=A0A375E5S6_9BURK|nr:formate dehydrogenase accessory sulfurtransferase FdhD [Cupriavidus taiwanensis]SOZ60834.1 formate dehydrogenase formation protein [Cupriavidus taiwanensis]SOZ61013.1 formate dehydrogenase formation protein [Cupriavidus taiwanensis]SOZ64929.1 formate dehydrogenase formation protein [Cupriavidus taiwanensis]SPA06878.1 formate dehydrogenase formation protein [Cupriavidus taiwanensis]